MNLARRLDAIEQQLCAANAGDPTVPSWAAACSLASKGSANICGTCDDRARVVAAEDAGDNVPPDIEQRFVAWCERMGTANE